VVAALPVSGRYWQHHVDIAESETNDLNDVEK
jgi:hypothetical protein